MDKLTHELAAVVNRHSAENGSNTPDFILAEYLGGCLAALDRAVNAREKWYGREEAARREAKTKIVVGIDDELSPREKALRTAAVVPEPYELEREGLGSAAEFLFCECCFTTKTCREAGACKYKSDAAKQRVENQDEIASLLETPAASVDGHSTDAEIAEVADAMRADLVTPFRLEVGREYARRDGTGPVRIVSENRDFIWPMRGDNGAYYTENGCFFSPNDTHPRDLVALWQAEAQAPEPSIADKCHALAARAVAERNGWPAPQADADEPRLTPEPGAVIWIDGFRYVHQPEAAPQTEGEVHK